MDDSKLIEVDLVHLANFAVKGQNQNIRLFLKSLAGKHRKTRPAFSKELSKMANSTSPIREILREDSPSSSIPVDIDSKQNLLMIEDPVVLNIEPIWSNKLDNLFGQILREHENQIKLKSEGLNPSRALLFYGPPGVGKTLAARWFAYKLNMPLLVLDLASVMSSFLGKTGNNLRAVLDYAKQRPSVLLLDEFDAIAKKRNDETEIGELKRLVTVLLQTVDQWDSPGMLIAASNHPELLDPAVWRRFDQTIEFEVPDKMHMQEAISSYFGSKTKETNAWVPIITELLEGKSFSDAEKIINSIRRSAIINQQPLEEIISSVIANISLTIPQKNRVQMAHQLMELGLSQRKTSDLLGVARDTIRHSKVEKE